VCQPPLDLQRAILAESGNESQAVVEFAPYQKIPAEKKKSDARTATIDKGTVEFSPYMPNNALTTLPHRRRLYILPGITQFRCL
jgi:hypothetical protein